mmetsp:Transcript_32802/g.75325  ORF Transcript_32802/g.75325 Transcript_32802/m.75325 type:complete len:356 (+) Transcript_32802:48-1115(+)
MPARPSLSVVKHLWSSMTREARVEALTVTDASTALAVYEAFQKAGRPSGLRDSLACVIFPSVLVVGIARSDERFFSTLRSALPNALEGGRRAATPDCAWASLFTPAAIEKDGFNAQLAKLIEQVLWSWTVQKTGTMGQDVDELAADLAAAELRDEEEREEAARKVMKKKRKPKKPKASVLSQQDPCGEPVPNIGSTDENAEANWCRENVAPSDTTDAETADVDASEGGDSFAVREGSDDIIRSGGDTPALVKGSALSEHHAVAAAHRRVISEAWSSRPGEAAYIVEQMVTSEPPLELVMPTVCVDGFDGNLGDDTHSAETMWSELRLRNTFIDEACYRPRMRRRARSWSLGCACE